MNELHRLYEQRKQVAEILNENQKVVGIFLHGSQNYELATENSDIDSRLLIIPSFKEMAINKQPISKEYTFENGEKTDIKDIRVYLQLLKKQNMNALEIFATKYKIVIPAFKDEIQELSNHINEIARINPYAAVQSMAGIARNRSKRVFDPFEDYNPKMLYQILRIEDFIEGYLQEEPFTELLVPKRKDFIISIKNNEIKDNETIRTIYEQAMNHIEKMISETEFVHHSKPTKEENLIDQIQYEIVKKGVREEFL